VVSFWRDLRGPARRLSNDFANLGVSEARIWGGFAEFTCTAA